MFLQRPRAAPPFPLPVSAISLGHTVFEMSRPTATAFQAAELCLGQSLAKYGAYGKREQPLGDAHTLAPLPGAGPSRPGGSASDRVPPNTVLAL